MMAVAPRGIAPKAPRTRSRPHPGPQRVHGPLRLGRGCLLREFVPGVPVLRLRFALALVQRLVQSRQLLGGEALGALLVDVAQVLDQVGFGAVLIGHLR